MYKNIDVRDNKSVPNKSQEGKIMDKNYSNSNSKNANNANNASKNANGILTDVWVGNLQVKQKLIIYETIYYWFNFRNCIRIKFSFCNMLYTYNITRGYE